MHYEDTPPATQHLPLAPSDTTALMSSRISTAHYTAEEVIATFTTLLGTLDFKNELQEIGIGKLHWRRKARAMRELKALSIAFWGLALQRSFPDNAEDFFAQYCATSPLLTGPSREAATLATRVNTYVDLLKEKKESDFLPVASYLAEIFALTATDTKRLQLRLSLIMRSLYTLIFKHLV